MAEEQASVTVEANPRLVSYFKAGYPLIYVVSAEEQRAETDILASSIGNGVESPSGRTDLYVWSCTEGLTQPHLGQQGQTLKDFKDPVKALTWVRDQKLKKHVYLFRDLHAFFGGSAGTTVVRLLRDLAKDLQKMSSTIIMLSPVARLPVELQRDVTQMDFDLPNRSQITAIFNRLRQGNEKNLSKRGITIDEDEGERIVSAALGLTSIEALNAFSMAFVDTIAGKGNVADLVLKEKAFAVKKSGILEYIETPTNMSAVGGLENLKEWTRRRGHTFTKRARDFGLPTAKGMLLVGIPGGGKSLSAKATASEMRVPLIRFDIAKVFAGLVGQSEENMRNALQTIDAIGPCVVWVDEMEKAFAGAGASGSGDNGVTRRVFGNFLTWMQEKTTPSFVVATANSIIGIPPEMLRKGRFDENFFIGLPGPIARGEIFKIQLQRYRKQRPADTTKGPAVNIDLNSIKIAELVENSPEMTGAEIEYAVIEGMFAAFEKDRPLTTDDVLKALKGMNPIAKSQKDELQAMTSWAENNAMAASRNDISDEKPVGRQLTL